MRELVSARAQLYASQTIYTNPSVFLLGKMGTSDDTSAVVDSRARVFGVTGLRVVDASAFPLLPPGHPMSSVCE